MASADADRLAQSTLGQGTNLLRDLTGNDENKTVDVVAIHGLFGDPLETWQADNGNFWLQSLLPNDLPSARIMAYGWTSNLTARNARTDLDTVALGLLHELSAKRLLDRHSSRPIVFICHDLGGTIFEKARVLADNRVGDKGYKDITLNTRVAAYLGVPHEGQDEKKWVEFMNRAAKAVNFGALKRWSIGRRFRDEIPSLVALSARFLASAPYLSILSFYETEECHGQLVVDKSSARAGTSNETLVAVTADHRTICKFPSAKAEEYRMVVGAIVTLVTQLVEETATTTIG